jgi:hypothetical protein
MRLRLPRLRKPKIVKGEFTGNCPIREHTGDGHYVGRCDFAHYDNVCPRHGLITDYPNNDDRDVPVELRFFSYDV